MVAQAFEIEGEGAVRGQRMFLGSGGTELTGCPVTLAVRSLSADRTRGVTASLLRFDPSRVTEPGD